MLIQFKKNCLIIWDNNIKSKSDIDIFTFLYNNYEYDIIFPYVDSKKLLDTILSLGAMKIEFHDDEEHTYNNIYGSYIISHKEN